jgi:hypothetical protein
MPGGGGRWTRREVLGRAGVVVAGAATLGVAGDATPTRSPAASQVQRFVSRPDLSPPVVSVTRAASLPAADDARYILLTPGQGGPGQGGAMILDSRGRLVWFFPATTTKRVMNLNIQAYRGQPVLTWFQGKDITGHGEGVGVIADTSYRTIATVRAGNGLMADLHEFILTPQGTALITAYRERPADLSSAGGPVSGTALSGVAQEIDVATGKLLFEWDSLDHVAVAESYLRYVSSGGENLTKGTGSQPFDYFHINSIATVPGGDLIISARNTSAAYQVSRADGQVRWRLGGRKTSFAMGPGTEFYWQHDVRPDPAGGLSLFDDGASPAHEQNSRALLLSLDTTAMRTTLRRQYIHPGTTLLANAMGNTQLLPDGEVFVGWGSEPNFTLFAADGRVLLDGTLPANDTSYRAHLADWTGHPTEPPAIAARARPHGRTSVYASWNGATGVRSWTMLAGSSASSLAAVSYAPSSGFETVLTAGHPGPYFAAEARDSRGRVMARSRTVRLGTTRPGM